MKQRMPRSQRKPLLWISGICLMCGLSALGWYFYTQEVAHIFQRREAIRFELPAAEQLGQRQPNCGFRKARQGESIGKIDIANVGLSVVVLEGDDPRTLRLGAGMVPGWARPGQVNNIAIAAHRDTFFRPLRDIRQGDLIQFTTNDGSGTYAVEWAKVVDPSDTKVLAATPEPTLTLITCYPFNYIGPAPKRFVVRAKEIATGQATYCRSSQVD
jgi:sortase A